CDSIITINLTIHNATDTAFSIATCQSYTSPSGKVYTADSILTDTILNSIGCDSIMTIDLTIFETAYDTSTLTKCVSYKSPSGKYIWTESGTYTDTVITAKGCDSIVTTHLTINKVDTSVLVTETELTANANFAAYQWLNCNNNYSKIDGATYQSFTPSTNGWYAIEITLQNGCVDTSACFGIGTSDIRVNDFGNDFNVYPNPTSGNVSIELGKTYHDVILSLKTLGGKKINTLEAGTCNRVEYTIQSPPGSYLLEIKAGENKKAAVKIIKH
ncbi:MAG: T9SS type A sorting domain-containing protein, partial [Bacteroidota bacterium]